MADGGGKGHIAYRKQFSFPSSPNRAWIAECRVVDYDCAGRPFGPIHTWETPGGVMSDGTKVNSVRGYGLLGSAGQCNIGRLQDVRSLDMIKEKCCPKELMNEFLETEGVATGEIDAAEEAMKLHKRGYLGGGG